ncbi:ribonuclease h protein [Artemisia annua]|uniref:Ribonuclease h protein n=1 Tax=Artemisia annua TaxID=35608 RepID=A0A2U1MPH0_ARTAN|nr:ribonuclease h protein [Artemisia annua]
MRLWNVVIETDSNEAFSLITVSGVDDSHPQSSLIRKRTELLLELKCYMVHTRSIGNRCADVMAKFGGTKHEDFLVYKEPPLKISCQVFERETALERSMVVFPCFNGHEDLGNINLIRNFYPASSQTNERFSTKGTEQGDEYDELAIWLASLSQSIFHNNIHKWRKMRLWNVVIETDSNEAFSLITVSGVDDSHPQSSLIRKRTELLLELKCYMVHTRRIGNRCADVMAKLGGTQHEDFLVYKEPPLKISCQVFERETALERSMVVFPCFIGHEDLVIALHHSGWCAETCRKSCRWDT